MSLFSRFFYKRPPDGLLEFIDRVYVFDSCFSTEVLPDGMYDIYLREILTELHEQFEDSSFLAFNFRKGEKRSHFAEVLCEYDVTVIDYPHQYEGCPLLPLSLIQHFLPASESWLSYGNQQNIILLHCERGGWPLLAFILASIVIFRRPQSGEKRTLETVHREAPKGFLQLLSPLNPMQSQLRYLQYVARRNISSEWPPMERSLSLDCLILRCIPSFDATNGCRPAIRIFGQNLHGKDTRRTIMLFSTSQKKKSLRHYKQVDCDVIKIDIQCAVRGDIVLECVHLDLDPEREVMMFRIMFNTAFIRSNILMLNCEDLDILWDARDRYPKGFRAEVLFGETDVNSSQGDPTAALNAEEQGGLPIEAFSSVQEIFSSVDWLNSSDSSAIWFLKQISATVLQEKIERLIMTDAKELSKLRNNMMDQMSVTSSLESEEENYESETAATVASFDDDSNLDIVDVASQTEMDCTTGTVQEVNIPTSKEVPEQIVYNILNSSVQTFIPLKSASAHEGDTLSCSDSSSEPSPSLPPTSLATEADEASSLCMLPTPSKCPPPTSPALPPPSPPPFTTQKILASHDKVHLPLHSTTSLPSTVTVLIPPPPPPPAMSSPLTMEPTSLPLTAPPFILVGHGLSSPPLAPPLPPTTRKTSPLVPPTPLLSPAASTVSSKGPPPPPPPPPPSFHLRTTLHNGSPCGSSLFSKAAAPPPPSCISFSQIGLSNEVTPPPPPPKSSHGVATPPPPPLPPKSSHGAAPPPPPPPPPPIQRPISKVPIPPPISGLAKKVPAPPPPPPPQKPGKKVPSPPPLPSSSPLEPPRIPPPPPPLHTGNHENASGPPQQSGTKLPRAQTPSAPCVGNFRTSISCTERGRASLSSNNAPKKSALKPLHWVKVTRAMQGSLWADTTKQDNQARSPDIDISELESLFSTAVATEGRIMNKSGVRRNPNANKSEIVHLVDMRRANNCEIMLTKIKMPLQDMVTAILALDASVLDIDQVENLIKFCPTKEEIEMLKNYTGNRETLGRCEQFFLELMKVPRVESKLRVFSFRITFSTQVKELRSNLNIINDASREVKGSIKLKQIMQTILTLGNVLNQGTARGSAVGFRLDSLLKLSDTRARNNKMTLMHYLCKILGEKMPELLDFDKDLLHLEAASKIQLKLVAEEMQAVSKGLEKVEQELAASESDGAISVTFRKALKEFLHTAEAEVRSLISLYSEVGRNADSLAQYFGEDPVRCPFEQVTSILAVFVNMFKKSREENARQAEAEKKKLEKEAIKDKANSSAKKDLVDGNKPGFCSQTT